MYSVLVCCASGEGLYVVCALYCVSMVCVCVCCIVPVLCAYSMYYMLLMCALYCVPVVCACTV